MSIITDVIESTKAIIQGMGVTLSYIPKRKWTVEYPDEPVTMQPRYRGQHLLHVDELGREKCVACYLCAAACPSEITGVASSAVTVSKPARKMPLLTGTTLSCLFTVARISSRPKTIC
jgi:formate hydrogenlyase subunit 6/NADH:ubiquinone oxidoreductase subunit I